MGFFVCGMMFFSFGAGGAFHAPDSTMSESMRQFGGVMGKICIAAGLFYASRILRIGPKGLKWITKTDAGKQFENEKIFKMKMLQKKYHKKSQIKTTK